MVDPVELSEQYCQAIVNIHQLIQSATENKWTDCQSILQQIDRQWKTLLANLTDRQRQALQPYHTEVDKEIQLIQTDVVMLKAAKQADTQQQRLQRLEQRGDRLITYLETLAAREPT